MKKIILTGLIYVLAQQIAFASQESELTIAYSKFVLDNGLTLIVHEDNKAPIVSVNIWYHVGSKDEKQGRTGFAHLFEHLMFNGSENNNDDWFKALDRVGATGVNGTTSADRTNYYQVVPKNALEMTLWMEADRMGHLLGAIDQAKLEEQRSVVRNEKRQGENQPYGKVFSTILANVYPVGHPYSWPVIGSMEDINAATLDDVHEWFKTKYGAANATLTIAGDVKTDEVKQLVEKHFGHIDSGPPLIKQSKWIAKRTGKQSQIMTDRVPQARIYKIWNVPEWGSAEADYLNLASGVLSSDKKSRLYNRLVYEERVASDVSAISFNSEIGGLFGIIATALDEDKLDYIDQAIDEELALFMTSKGPTKKELDRVRTGYRADFIRGMERIAGKSNLLAKNQVFTNNPNHYLISEKRISEATAKQVVDTAKQWLSDGQYSLKVLPQPDYKTTPSSIDRTLGIPDATAAPTVSFDKFEKATLSNGIELILAKRSSVPVISMRMMINSGFAADQFTKPGTANLTMQMLDEGTKQRDALEISSELSSIGSQLSTSAGLDISTIKLSSLSEHIDESLEIFADVILNPTFPENEFTRLKQQQLAAIAQEKSSPFRIGYRVLPSILYGENHAYSGPFSGSGNEESIADMNLQDLQEYHQQWFKANNATLLVVGDIELDEIQPKLEKVFASMPAGDVPQKNIAAVEPSDESVIYLINKPESEQTAIIAASLVPEYGFEDELPLKLANEVLGGSFSARINMNLREDKGWSYGAGSFISNTQAQRPFIIQSSVQSDKTTESILEILNELNGLTNIQPATEDELARSLDKRILTLPGRWETSSAVEADIANMVRFELEDDYWDNYVTELRNIDLDQVNTAAKKYIKPETMTWVLIGDLSKIESKIRRANLGKVVILDQD